MTARPAILARLDRAKKSGRYDVTDPNELAGLITPAGAPHRPSAASLTTAPGGAERRWSGSPP